jgi:hypothetical protein
MEVVHSVRKTSPSFPFQRRGKQRTKASFCEKRYLFEKFLVEERRKEALIGSSATTGLIPYKD